MGRRPSRSKEDLNRGAWTIEEDKILREYISVHGEGKWRKISEKAGLKRCGKSCRLRWLNYLKPDIKRGNISPDEEDLIIRLHKLLGNRWSLIAGRLPGRTDNEIKNYWNTNLGKKVRDGTTTSSAQPQQPIENNPPSLSLFPSHVVRTKASKCSKLFFIDPLSHPSTQLQGKSKAEQEAEEEPVPVDDAKSNNSTGNKMEPGEEEEQLSTDFLLDFDIGQISLSDLLISDFSDVLDFSYNNDNSHELLPCPDQPQVSSEEVLEDWWTQRNFSDDETNVANNLHSFTCSFEPRVEWLGE